MKREFLEGLGLTKEVIDKIMAENGNDIEAAKSDVATIQQKLTTAETENTGLKQQLSGRDNDIKALQEQVKDNADLSSKLTNLQKQYNDDTKALQTKLDEQAYDHAAEKYLDGFKFSSASARKAVLSDFRDKKFKLTDGKFEGAEEFMNALKKEDPDSFASEKPKSENNGGQSGAPVFTSGFNNPSGTGEPTNPFNFGFTPVRQTKK